MCTVGAALKLELLRKESTHALLRHASVVCLSFFFLLLFFFSPWMFCIDGGCELSGAMFVLEFSRSGIIGDGRRVTERMQCFRCIMVPRIVFVLFSLLFRS